MNWLPKPGVLIRGVDVYGDSWLYAPTPGVGGAGDGMPRCGVDGLNASDAGAGVCASSSYLLRVRGVPPVGHSADSRDALRRLGGSLWCAEHACYGTACVLWDSVTYEWCGVFGAK